MMNYVWTGIIVFSFAVAVFTGNISALSGEILNCAVNAVNTSLKLLATMTLWNGLSEIIVQSKADKIIEKLMKPFMRLVFPKYRNTSAGYHICANITANLLGLGNAATPLGIEAMRRIKSISKSDTADDETVRFIIINSAALTLIPTTQAFLRAAAGSKEPFGVTVHIWLTGIISLTFALVIERILAKRWKL